MPRGADGGSGSGWPGLERDLARARRIVGDMAPGPNAEPDDIAVLDAVLEHSQFLLSMLRDSLDGVVVTDPDGCFVEANPAACALYGRDRAELLGRRAIDLVADVPAAEAHRERMLERGSARAVVSIRRPDGEVRHFEYGARGRAFDDHNVSVFRDVTERVEAERARASAEHRLDQILWNLPVVLFATDRDGVITLQRGRALATAAPDEHVGEPLETLYGNVTLVDDGGDTWTGRELMEAVLERGESLSGLVEFGGVVYDMHCYPHYESDEIAGMLGIGLDVTGRRRTEIQLAETSRLLTQLIEMAPLGIGVFDLEGTPRLWNPTARRLLGYTAEEMAREGVPVESEDELRRFRDSLRSGRAIDNHATRRRTRDGREIELLLSQGPLRDASGDLIGAVVMFSDITERTRLERELAQSQKMEAIGRLAGGVAHDFNNMLAAIQGFASVVSTGLQRADPLQRDVEQIMEAADRAADLVRQLLAVSRNKPMEVRVFDLRRTIRGLESMLRRLLGEDVDVSLTVPEQPLPVRGDEGQLEQIVLNLVVNARDAMVGGGDLTIAAETARVETDGPAGPSPGPYVRLTVTDTGVGMNEATRKRVFEPFFTTKEEGRGTGLGLSTVYGVVTQMGGAVDIDSGPGRGTRVSVLLPRSEQAVEERRPARRSVTAAPRGGETVVVVEDDPLVRRMMVHILGRSGYRVLEARDPGEALLIAEEEPAIAAVVTDVVMPRMSGFDLVTRLRRSRPGLPALYTSAYQDIGVPSEAARGPLLRKPFQPAELLRQIRRLLDGAALTDDLSCK